MSPNEEVIRKLHEDQEHLVSQIGILQQHADASPGAIRMYRSHRVSQFKAREEDLAQRLSRIETSDESDDELSSQAEELAAEYRDAVILAEATAKQISPL